MNTPPAEHKPGEYLRRYRDCLSGYRAPAPGTTGEGPRDLQPGGLRAREIPRGSGQPGAGDSQNTVPAPSAALSHSDPGARSPAAGQWSKELRHRLSLRRMSPGPAVPGTGERPQGHRDTGPTACGLRCHRDATGIRLECQRDASGLRGRGPDGTGPPGPCLDSGTEVSPSTSPPCPGSRLLLESLDLLLGCEMPSPAREYAQQVLMRAEDYVSEKKSAEKSQKEGPVPEETPIRPPSLVLRDDLRDLSVDVKHVLSRLSTGTWSPEGSMATLVESVSRFLGKYYDGGPDGKSA